MAYQSPGSPAGYVNDFAGMLTSETKTTLEETLTQFTKETSSEVSVVAITNLGGDSIENYANELFREWGIGTKNNNNGILLLISKDDRKLRIEVGYGLEGALPDATAHSIITNDITPLFKEGNYDSGVTVGVQKIIEATKGEYTAPVTQKKNTFQFGEVLLFILFFGFNILVSILAPSKSWWLGGVIGGVLGGIIGFIFWSLIGGVILGGVLLGLGLLIDFIVSKAYQKGGPGTGGFGGFWIGGGSSGRGGGFGGFSGGSSGGGGASGSW